MKAFKLGLELLTALFECRILDVVFKVIDEVHNFALKYLHSVHYFVEFRFVFHYQLFLDIHTGGVPWHPHSDPVVFLLNHVVDSFNAHEEAEYGAIIGHSLFIKDDFQRPIALNIADKDKLDKKRGTYAKHDRKVVQAVQSVSLVLLRIVRELNR